MVRPLSSVFPGHPPSILVVQFVLLEPFAALMRRAVLCLKCVLRLSLLRHGDLVNSKGSLAHSSLVGHHDHLLAFFVSALLLDGDDQLVGT